MESAISSKKIIFKFFMLLFAINVSFIVLPGGIVTSYGLLGEVASVSTEENQESGIQSNPNKRNPNKRNANSNLKKRVKVQYSWLMLFIMILFIHYSQYWLIYSNDGTPVALKVRMNN